jgi:hypothetical protein
MRCVVRSEKFNPITRAGRACGPQLARVKIVAVAIDQQRRLQQMAASAHNAQKRGDHAAANEAWRRYVLIEDALRDPQELLDEGVALSKVAIDLWLQR